MRKIATIVLTIAYKHVLEYQLISAKFAFQKLPLLLSLSLTAAAILADIKFLTFARKLALKTLLSSKSDAILPSKITALALKS